MSPLSKNNRYEIVRFRIENAVRTLDEAFFSHDKTSAESLYPEAKVFVNTVKNLVDDWLDKQDSGQEG